MKTKITKHFFSVGIAIKYDVETALILENLLYWIEQNRANDINKHEGTYWTYNSISAFHSLFPYLSEHKIRYALKKLEKEGIIITGNFNKVAYDRTKWYAITETGYSILENQQLHLPKSTNGIDKTNKPIPINKPNNKPNKQREEGKNQDFDPFTINTIEKFWVYIEKYHPNTYKQFIKKKEKTEKNWFITIDRLKRLDGLTEDEILKAIKNVINDDFWRKQFRTLSKLRKKDKEGVKYVAKFLDMSNEKDTYQDWLEAE